MSDDAKRRKVRGPNRVGTNSLQGSRATSPNPNSNPNPNPNSNASGRPTGTMSRNGSRAGSPTARPAPAEGQSICYHPLNHKMTR